MLDFLFFTFQNDPGTWYNGNIQWTATLLGTPAQLLPNQWIDFKSPSKPQIS